MKLIKDIKKKKTQILFIIICWFLKSFGVFGVFVRLLTQFMETKPHLSSLIFFRRHTRSNNTSK